MVMAVVPPDANDPAVHVAVVAVLLQVNAGLELDAPLIVPDGTEMLITAEEAASGPALAAFTVQVTAWPALTGFGVPLTAPIERSAAGLTVTVAVCESFTLLGSAGEAPLSVAVFVCDPVAVAFNTTTTVAGLPMARAGKLQVIGPVPEQVPALGVAEKNVHPALKVSLMLTLAGVAGPRFATVMLKDAFWPLLIVAGPLLVT